MARLSRPGMTALFAVLMLGACSAQSSTVPLAEQEVAADNVDAVLTDAEALFNQRIVADLPTGTTTLEDGGRCFLSGHEAAPDADLYCGPVRNLGAEAPTWYSIPMTVKADRESLLLSLDHEERFVSVDTEPQSLHRPDDLTPPGLADLPEPEAPPFPEANFARLLPEGSLDATVPWEVLEEPAVLHAPAATLRVTAAAQLETLPATLTTSEEAAPFYRPADGQTVSAWKLEVLQPIVPGPPKSGWSPRQGARDASARLSVPSGAQRLPVEESTSDSYGSIPGETSSGTFTVECTDGVPCATQGGRYVLLVSTGEEDGRLVVSTDGEDQTLSLSDGTIESSVSAVADERSQLETRLSTTWPRQVLTILTQDEADEAGYRYLFSDVTLTYAGQLDSAYLSPFHWEGGWAEPGRAWLSVPVDSDPQQLRQASELSYDPGATYTLVIGDEVLGPAHMGTPVFDVPADFTSGEFRYRPTGSVQVDGSPVAFQAEEPLSVEIEFGE